MGTKTGQWSVGDEGDALGLERHRRRQADEPAAPPSREVHVVRIDVPFTDLVNLAIKGVLAYLVALVVLSPILAVLAFLAVFALSVIGTVVAG